MEVFDFRESLQYAFAFLVRFPLTWESISLCEMFNDIDGRENHLVKVQGCPDYEVPAKGSEPEPVVDAPKKKKENAKARAKNQGKKRSIKDLNDLVLEIYSCMCLCFVLNFLSSCNRRYLSISNFFTF